MADYSFSPQFANLSGLQPLPALDVTRGAALQFQPLQAIQVQSSRPELVAEGIAGAVSNIAQGALSGITARYEKAEAEEKEERAFAQQEKIARIKAAQSLSEKEEQRGWEWKKMQEQNRLIQERAKGVLPPSVQFEDESLPTNETTATDNSDILTGELYPEGVGLDENGNIKGAPSEIPQEDNRTGLISSQDSNAIALNVAKQIDPATGLPLSALPEYLSASTGAAPIAPLAEIPSLGLGKVDASFVSPEQEQEIAATSAELGKISEVKPEIEKQIPVGQAKAVKYFQSQEKANEEYAKMYPGWKAAQLPELVQTKSGPAFSVKREIISPEEQEDTARRKRKEDIEIAKAEMESQKIKKNKPEQYQIQGIEGAIRANATLDDIEKQLEKIKEKSGPFYGRFIQYNPYDSDVKLLDQMIRSIVPTLARGVYGEVGVLTDNDIKNYRELIPDITKTEETSKKALNFLRNDIGRSIKNKLDIWEATNFEIQGLKDLYGKMQQVKEPSEKEDLINKINNASEEYKNSPQFQQDRNRLKELLKTK
jgi:hypothetical protein